MKDSQMERSVALLPSKLKEEFLEAAKEDFGYANFSAAVRTVISSFLRERNLNKK